MGMSDYERAAWYSLCEEATHPRRQRGLPAPIRRVASRAGGAAQGAWQRAPGADAGTEVLRRCLAGLKGLTIDPALQSVVTSRVLRSYQRAGHPVRSLKDIRALDLEVIDRTTPQLQWRYSAAAALEGAGAGLAISGGEALALFGSVAGAGAGAAPGAGTVLGAMAIDAAAVMAGSARSVAHVAAYHGFDVRQPEEAIFALSVLTWSTAGTEGTKAAAFSQLSLITQQLARGATWAQLGDHLLVKVVQELYIRLGLRLTERKLGQMMPVVGIGIGASLNAQLLRRTTGDARTAYRLRLLSSKYGLDPLASTGRSEQERTIKGDVIDIEAVLHEVEASEDQG